MFVCGLINYKQNSLSFYAIQPHMQNLLHCGFVLLEKKNSDWQEMGLNIRTRTKTAQRDLVIGTSDDCWLLRGMKIMSSVSQYTLTPWSDKVFTLTVMRKYCASKRILSVTSLLFPWVRYGKPPHKPPLPDASWTPTSRPPQTPPQKYSHPHSWRFLQSVKKKESSQVMTVR